MHSIGLYWHARTAPPLTAAEYQIVKSYGDWTCFMQAYGLKPWDEDDIQEAHAIVQTMAREDERQQEGR